MPTQRQLFLDHLSQTSDSPLLLEIESAEGIYLTDTSGKKYVDLISGIGVSSVGHRHPQVVEAIHDQADKHLHLMVYGEYVQSPQVKLAEAICSTLPANLNSVYLLNSGSEAIEGAMKLAKRHTGRSEIISCIDAYHGSSHGALSITGNEDLKRNFRPMLPLIKHIRFGSIEDLNQITDQTAAFFIETVQGEAGVRVADYKYFEAVRKKCDETGTLLVLDEVQCGFGRTGKFWAFEHYDIIPDILVSAKGMGGGMPISCFISEKSIMQCLMNEPVLGHISTFGGHPLSAAASLATIAVLTGSDLIQHVFDKEKLFLELLVHPKIKEVRSLGLMMALQFESYDILKPIIDKAIELGVITDWFLFNNSSMRIAPPLTITKSEIRSSCELILKAIG
ncbi:MAG: aspartate aminotransferase family protein [Cyclobacteriaceae bacterium]